MRVKIYRIPLFATFILVSLLHYMVFAKDSLDYQKPLQEQLVFNPNKADDFNEKKIATIFTVGLEMISRFQCRTGAPNAATESIETSKLKEYLLLHSKDSLWCEQYAKILWYEFKKNQIESRYVAVKGKNGNHSFVECTINMDGQAANWASLQPTSNLILPLFRKESYGKALSVFDMIYCQKNNIDITNQTYINNSECKKDNSFKDLKYFTDVEQVYVYRTTPSANKVYKMLQKLQLLPYRIVYTEQPSNWGFYSKIFIVYFLFIGSLLFFLIKKILWILKK